METRQKVVEEFNKRFEANINITCDDGEIISFNENWILDSEFMNYVHDNEPSQRIKDFIKNKPISEGIPPVKRTKPNRPPPPTPLKI